MFHFMKKDKDDKKKDKDKDKDKKKDKKERRITLEELRRLEEARRSLVGKTKKKEKLPSGITADFMQSFTQAEREALASRGSVTSMADAAGGSVPPRPPKRTGGSVVSLRGSLQDYQLVADSLVTGPAAAGAESSVRNEVLNYERLLQRRTSGTSSSSGAAAPAAAAAAAPPLPSRPPPSPSQSTQSTPSSSSVQRLARQFEAVPRGSPTTLSPSGSMRSSASSATTLSEPRAGEASGGRAPHRFPGHELRLPALHTAPPPPPRLLRIARLPGGDFGFALRRAVVQERTAAGESRRPVILAEPGRSSSGEPGGTGLLPGDRLIEVNGVSVEDADREKVVALIRASGDTVTLKVQPIPEVSELSQRRAVDGSQLAVPEDGLHPARRDGTLRRTGSLRFANKAKTEDQLASERAWLDAEQVWLVHKDGFSAARLLRAPAGAAPPGADGAASDTSALSSGRVRIRLQDTGETIEVDEDDIEKANPPQFDQCEELSQLRHLNESSVLHTLRQRYGGNLIHTAAGASTVIVNPMSSLSIYTEKVIQMFRGCKPDDMPPHIYSTAQSTYRALLGQRRDQGVVLLGRSGSGKTTNAKHLLHYLVAASQAAAPPNAAARAVTVEKLAAVWTLLEAFGNCRTVLNTNATRFTSVFSLDFDQSGQAASGSVQVLMLERDRVVRRPEGEPSFHVFYQLLAGADPALRQRLQLDDAGAAGGDGVGFVTPLQRVEDRQRAAAAWARLQRAVDVLSIHPAEADALWSVLAAIVHLGVAGVSKGPSDKYQFADPAAARRAASLLGVPLEDLARAMFAAQSSGAATLQRTAYRTPPRVSELAAAPDPLGREALEAFVAGLYGDLVSVLVSLVNRAISSPAHTINSVVVVDAPGLQNPSSCGRPGGATFDEFCFNYVQERLQLLFHEQTFVHERDRYAQENIALNMSELEGDVSTPAPLVQTLDRAPATRLVRGPSQQDLRGAERRGLLWLLDEEALQQAPSDAGFLRTALDMYSQRGDQQVLSKGPSDDHMVLQHFQGTNPVTYNVSGWVRAARETAASRAAAQLLYESTREALSRLFVTARGAGLGPAVAGGSVVGIDGSLSLRRASSIRRTFTSGAAGIKRNSRALLVKFQLDGVVEQLRRTRVRFVHCLLPQHTAGLCELAATSTTAPATPQKTASPEEIIINVPLLRSQLRGAQLLDALRLHKQGYPEHMPFSEFRRRFALLAPDVTADAADEGDERAIVDQLMLQLDVDAASYRLGLSQIFFRSGALSQLEERRDERLQDKIVRLQARCRGLLARKKFARRKVQDVAIRCIQKNVRKYMGVREWPWWRLLVRVTPLLDVHRTEQQLQSATEELAALREKVERLEKENTTYKHENDRLESKLGEVTADLAEEHHTATLATERLEAEQAERMRLESDLQSVQSEYQKTSALNERLEKELLYRRTSAELGVSSDGDGDEEDGELGSAAAYQRKYEYTARELAYTRQRLEQQHEDDVEQMMVLKKQLDKKVEAAYEEVDEQRQIVAQQKRKVARLTGEANDLRIHLEEQTSRNTVLEKKQRKFDIDMHALQEELRHEKQQREAAVRQADQLQREKCSLDNDAAALRLELEMQEEKVTALRRELDELSTSGAGGTEDEVSALRRARLDLQHKCQEQEEELDDMAGQVSLLEQAKLRLEMSLEQMRKEHRREVSQKDDELEEIRANASKKLKGLEAQLETEHEERTALVREKHELERRIIMLNETTISQDDQEAILKLKRDLKRTRALLKDAQAQLEKARSEASSKVQIRQLKNQLEDAEFARGAAVKARQSLAQELQETQALLEEAQRARTDTETRYLTASRELHQLQAQLDDQEEETQEVMKKYKAAVAQLSVDQLTLQDQASQLTQLEAERAALREQLAEQATRLDALQGETASAHDQRRLELRVRELESRCEFEQTTKLRLETQAARLKEAVEKASNESEQARQREQHAADQLRKLQRQLRESKDELSEAERKESDAVMQARSLAKELESAEGEVAQARADLKLAFKRIGDLQNAMQCELESDASDSEAGSDSDEEDLDSFMSAHMAAGGSGARRTSAAAGGQPLSILTDGRSAGSESTPLSPLSLASDPELRPRQNGALESDA